MYDNVYLRIFSVLTIACDKITCFFHHIQGDYDPTKLKVLHFKMNPADMGTADRQAEITKLKEENDRLKQRIQLLEENEGKIEDLTVAVEQKLKEPGSSKDIEGMT